MFAQCKVQVWACRWSVVVVGVIWLCREVVSVTLDVKYMVDQEISDGHSSFPSVVSVQTISQAPHPSHLLV